MLFNRVTRRQAFGLAAGLLLLGSVLGLLASGWDHELRCCFAPSDIRKVFLITLVQPEFPVAHLRLTTPAGAKIGFEPGVNRFYQPIKEGVYASAPPEGMPLDSPDSHKRRNRMLVLRQLHEGRYRLDVIGVESGRYFLSFHPAGEGDSHGAQFFGDRDGIAISPGEIHVYTFSGRFDDVFDGGIPLDSPTRFRVRRGE